MARVTRHYVSKLFQPVNVTPKNAEVKHSEITSRSQKLMLDLGFLRQAFNGLFYLLPLGERSLSKLIGIVDDEMSAIGGQKLILPTLVPASLWKKSGRFDSAASELFTLEDRHSKELVLSPTHEEAITELMSTVSPISYRQLPLRLYQTTSKFRDEMKPRFGLIRSKEFMMKDLYTFDVGSEEAKKTYNIVTAAYDVIFKRIGIKYVRVAGPTGLMGGSLSHEFHFPSNVGEDRLVICDKCGHGNNEEVFSIVSETQDKIEVNKCFECGHGNFKKIQGIEVGHTFLLGTRYSKVLGAEVLLESGKPAFTQMGCYGLGLTRILAGVVECMSLETEIRWPLSLAPFKVCVIPPKEGSKESKLVPNLTDALCHGLEGIPWLQGDIIIDDRVRHTIGKRLMEAKRTGYPLIAVLGRGVTESEPLIEVHEILTGKQISLPLHGTLQYIADNSKIDAELLDRHSENRPLRNTTHG